MPVVIVIVAEADLYIYACESLTREYSIRTTKRFLACAQTYVIIAILLAETKRSGLLSV